MQNINKGLFDQVLRELRNSTYCVRGALYGIEYFGHPPVNDTSWDGYWLDTNGRGVHVHAMDKSMNMYCECADGFWETGDDEEEETPPPSRYSSGPGAGRNVSNAAVAN
jgi:hypothetical protein